MLIPATTSTLLIGGSSTERNITILEFKSPALVQDFLFESAGICNYDVF